MPGGEEAVRARLHAWTRRWWRGGGGAAGRALDRLLWPAEALYRGATALRNRGYDAGWLRSRSAPIPVLSVGNLAVGGAGKTPVSAWLASFLAGIGRRPAIVLRGYGADEVLVHRELNPGVPVIAARRRVEGVARAAAAGCDVAVLDDGFQHRALRRRLDLVLVAAESWAAHHRLLPRGPWREGPGSLRRAAAIVVTRKTAGREEAERIAGELAVHAPHAVLAVCRLAPTGLVPLHDAGSDPRPLSWLAGREVLAVATLADPEPFAAQLRAAGATVELLALPDHHDFDAAEVARIEARAGRRPLLMTRKEAVKLRALLAPSTAALLLDQRVEVERGREPLERLVRDALEAR